MPVASFVEGDLQPRGLLATSQHRRRARPQDLPFINHPFQHGRDGALVGLARHLHVIGLGHMRRRIGDARRPHRVVRHQQQALAGLVQAPHGAQPGQAGTFQQRIDRVPPPLVGGRHHETAGLVHHDIDRRRRLRAFAVHLDAFMARDGKLGIAHHAPVHAYPPFPGKAFALASRADAAFGEDPGEAEDGGR
ncbi:hypothetical protein KCV01_g16991, partial [Aureobasidium melanogenum]